MEGNYNIFYTPEKQYPDMPHGEMCGDFMPFYWDKTFYLFYLYKYCVYVTKTKDFVRYEKPSLVIQNGSPEDQDWHIGTGSVFFSKGIFRFYYTGFCERHVKQVGKNEQVVMRAMSTDLENWEKDEGFFLKPDTDYYENLHWRDPQVFWNEELGKYCMLITATEKGGVRLRNGCTAVFISDDVINWEHYRILYSPYTHITHECNDAFKMGDWWYLCYSNYSHWWETRYRIAKTFDGMYLPPKRDDMFDGRQFYAAKTVTDGNKRYLVGWQAVRKNCNDNEPCIWGGNALVHELVQREDGSLGVSMVQAIEDSFSNPLPLDFKSHHHGFNMDEISSGEWKLTGEVPSGFGWVSIGRLTETCLYLGTVSWAPDTKTVGLMIHADGENLDQWVSLSLLPDQNRIVVDNYKRIDKSQLYIEERPVYFKDNKARIKMLVSGSVILIYVDDVALTSRCYDIKPGELGIFVEYGEVVCEDMRLMEQ